MVEIAVVDRSNSRYYCMMMTIDIIV